MQHFQHQSAVAVATVKNRYLILAIVLAGTLMSVLDALVVNIALPTITEHYGSGIAGTQWVVTAYLVTMTCLLLLFGKISEHTGKARLFMAGSILFTVSSLACGLSGSLAELVAFRVVQAVGAAMMFSISVAIIFEVFPSAERGRALGLHAATVALGSILGPVAGGFIIDALGWNYIFFINLPIGIVIALASLKYLKLDEKRSPKLEMDRAGSVLFILAVIALLAALGDISASAGITPTAAALCVAFIICASAFLWNESRHRTPLLDLSLFRDTRFLLPLACMLLFYVAHITVNVVGPFYYEGVLGYDASQVGLLYMIVFVSMVVASPVSGWLYDRYHSKYHSAAGMGVIVLSIALLGFAFLQKDILLIGLSLAIMGIGDGLFQAPNNVEALEPVPADRLGTASSTLSTARNLAMAIGASFVSILMALQLSEADIMFVLAVICVPGIVLSLLRNLTSR